MPAKAPFAAILVVDDDRSLLRLIQKALQRERFTVATATSGKEAIVWLAHHRAGLILLNPKLHDIEGKELVGRLRDADHLVPFVIITDRGDEGVAVDMMKLGALDYLVKDGDFLQHVPEVVLRALGQVDREKKLAEAEKQARLSQTNIEQSYSGIMITSADGANPEIIYVNPAFAKLAGCAANELVGHRLHQLEALTGRWEHFRNAVAARRSVLGETKVCRRGGEPRIVDCNITPVLDPSGIHTHWAVLLRDVTDRKQAEEALRHSEANLAGAQQIAHLGSYEINVTGNGPDHWSLETFRILGLDPASEELASNDYIRRIVHPADQARVLRTFAKSVSQGIRFDLRYRIVRPGGSIRHVHSLAEPVLGQDDKVAKLVGTLQDITERRALEREVQEISQREQRRIGRDLHDGLGQQLTAIELMCQSLRSDLVTIRPALGRQAAQICRYLNEAVSETRTLAHRLAAFKVQTEGLPAALLELAQTTSLLGRVRCRFRCLSPVALNDSEAAGHLYRIAQEAVNNAVRHSRGSVVTIHLYQGHGVLRLQVSDNGKGLPRKMKPADGIGLDLMKHRASVVGAELDIQSRSGKGVTVICRLRTRE